MFQCLQKCGSFTPSTISTSDTKELNSTQQNIYQTDLASQKVNHYLQHHSTNSKQSKKHSYTSHKKIYNEVVNDPPSLYLHKHQAADMTKKETFQSFGTPIFFPRKIDLPWGTLHSAVRSSIKHPSITQVPSHPIRTYTLHTVNQVGKQ